MLCASPIFYHVGNPYSYFPYQFPPGFFPQGCFLSVEQRKYNRNLWGNIRHGPYSLTACWAEPFTSERHTAGYSLHRVIAFGFWGIQECISTIINKSALAGRQQLLDPSGDEIRQLNSLINAAPIVCRALGIEKY